MNIRQVLIETIENDLRKITTSNGYNTDVYDVKRMYIDSEQVSVFPTLWFEFQNGTKEPINEDGTIFRVKENWFIGGYIKTTNDTSLTGVAVNEIEKLLGDIEDCVENRKAQSFSIHQITGVEYPFVNQSYPYIISDNNVIGCLRGIEIEYTQTELSNQFNVSRPDVPSLTSPSDAGISETLYTVFDWVASNGAISYHFQLATDSTFNNLFIDQDYLVNNSFTIPVDKLLTNNTSYYFRVRSYNNVGYSNWSSIRSFTVVSSDITPLNWNQISSSISWWNTYSSSGILISSGISALLDQIGSRRLSQGTSTRRPSLSGNTYSSLSSAYFNPLTATESYVLGFNDTSGFFDWSNTSTGTFMFVMMSNGNYFDYPSSYNCVVARSNTSFGGQMAFIRGVNTGPIGYTYAYPGTSGDYMTIPCATGVPHQIIVSHSGSAHNIWIDGVKLFANKNYTNLSITNNANTFLNIGAYYNDASSHANGKYVGHIFEAGFATAALTSGQVASLYEGFKNRFNLD
jgi:hypothetical protein